MTPRPLTTVSPNTFAFLQEAMIAPAGFREYDARWRYPQDINLPGITALGLGLGTQMRRRGIRPQIAVGNDYRDYALAVKNALVLGLMQAGIQVRDIGVALSPMAYFAQFHLDAPAVAMVTASHNPNGWTGVKMGFERPLTHGPEEMAELRDIVLQGKGQAHAGGSYERVAGVREAYLEDLVRGFRLTRPLKIVCATGNGTASAFAPDVLARLGAEVVPLHAEPDYNFPHYNPNPEAMEMLHDMAAMVQKSGADFALGFDGDGDRCGVVDDEGKEIFADKMGVILARDFSVRYPGATFVADVKSTGLFASDPELRKHGTQVEYYKTGHSHMKRRVAQLGALAGFEKSGHYFLADPVGRGYDCGLRVAVEICKLMERNPNLALADLHRALPTTYSTPTMSPWCADGEKYQVLERIVQKLVSLSERGGTLASRAIAQVITVNGARVVLENGSWGLVRASSNTPNLVVVCESTESAAELRAIFADLDAIIRSEPAVGAYDQTF
ncbi:MAG: phosphomannomutase/phosphoglucomutase [Rhodobacteraceae bacterium]|nr:phosphomannomutase/phosphoglucomutase [Paracoccaceae bacterium]